jgi:hypothetical protein
MNEAAVSSDVADLVATCAGVDRRSSPPGVRSGPRTPGSMPTLERRERVLLQMADMVSFLSTVGLGSFALRQTEPVRAGALSIQHMTVTVLALVVSFHLHGMYRGRTRC